MKTIILTIVSFFTANLLIAQNDVYLNIHHLLNGTEIQGSFDGTNNLGNDFSLNRMQYYLSNFKIVHDGGQELAVTDLYALVDGKFATQISVGSLNVVEIEGIKFSVGVDAANNHLDPATYSSFHPLAPKNPSMHWGWTSGYRFVAMEGTGGSTNQVFEIHALGDNLYYEVNIPLEALEDNGSLYLNIDADYTEAIRDINVNSGLIQHGSSGEAVDLLLNFQTNVFKASTVDTVATGIRDIQNDLAFSVFPNPSSGKVNFSLDNIDEVESLEIYNTIGSLLDVKKVFIQEFYIEKMTPGIYFAVLKDKADKVIGRTKIIFE